MAGILALLLGSGKPKIDLIEYLVVAGGGGGGGSQETPGGGGGGAGGMKTGTATDIAIGTV